MPPNIERIYTWDEEQVSDFIDRAVAIVDTLGIPADLRRAAFEKAVAMLSHHNAIAVQSPLAIGGVKLDG